MSKKPASRGPATKRGSRAAPATPATHAALLRGINVGGRNKLPMRDLAALFEDAGCRDVRTYIQSGNVVFSATATVIRAVPRRVEAAIRDGFGITTPVIVRSAAELAKVVTGVPFRGRQADPSTLHVAFLSAGPVAGRAAALDADRSPGDAFRLAGREIYLFLPGGVARTKLTNRYFDTALGVTSTIRNWRTVLELARMSTPV